MFSGDFFFKFVWGFYYFVFQGKKAILSWFLLAYKIKPLWHYSVNFRIMKNEQKSEMQVESPYTEYLNYGYIKMKMF